MINFRKIKPQSVISSLSSYIMLLAVSFIILYPLVYMLVMTFRDSADIIDPSVIWLTKNSTTDNLKMAIKVMDYPAALLRTVIMSLGCALLQCFTAALTGYGFARFRFKGNNILFMIVLFSLMVPPQIISMPLFLTFRNFDFVGLGDLLGGWSVNLINTPVPMYSMAFFGTGIRAGLFIYMFRQSFKNAPKELEEAASIDGCGSVKTFFKVMLPNSGSIILISFLFSLVWYWNDYFFSSMFYNKSRTLAVALQSGISLLGALSKPDGSQYMWNDTFVIQQAGCLLFILPLLIVYIFLQKYFVESIERSGIVG